MLAATELTAELIATMKAHPDDRDIDVDYWTGRLLDVQTELWRVRWACGLTAERSDQREQLAAKIARRQAEQEVTEPPKPTFEEDLVKLARDYIAQGKADQLPTMIATIGRVVDGESPEASSDKVTP